MKIEEIFKGFTEECWKKLNLTSIVQFGSSTTSKNPQDIDVLLISKGIVFSTNDYVKLFETVKNYEKRYKEVVFDIGGDKNRRKRKGKYFISIIPINNMDIKLIKTSSFTMDKFFFRNLSEDKNKKILHGENQFNFKIELNKKEIGQILSVEVNHTLRQCLDDDKSKLEAMYYLFKTALRLMLVNYGNPSKDKLLELFRKNYRIPLPKNAERILKHVLVKEDFESVLNFSEQCLRFVGEE